MANFIVFEYNYTKTSPEKMATLEEILYGTEDDEPRLPMPAEIIELFKDVPAAG